MVLRRRNDVLSFLYTPRVVNRVLCHERRAKYTDNGYRCSDQRFPVSINRPFSGAYSKHKFRTDLMYVDHFHALTDRLSITTYLDIDICKSCLGRVFVNKKRMQTIQTMPSKIRLNTPVPPHNVGLNVALAGRRLGALEAAQRPASLSKTCSGQHST